MRSTLLTFAYRLKMMPLVFLLLIALPIILFLYFQTQKSKHAKKHQPPAPPTLPFIGNLHQFYGSFTCLYRLSKQYGPIISLKLGFRRAVIISSVDAVKEIMTSHDAVFSTRPALVSLRRLSYNGLEVAYSPYNDTWREMRKISTIHLFSSKPLFQSFLPTVKDEVSKLMKKIAMDASSSTIIDLNEMMISFSTNNVSRFSFGKSYGEEGHYGKNRYINLLHKADAVIAGFFVEDYLPWFRWIDRLSGMAAKLNKSFHDLDSFSEEVIEEHMNPNRPKSMDGDIIDIMLRMIRDGSSSTSTFHLTFDHIKALIMDLIVGGSDSASATIVWAMTALIKKPLLMKKVQAEIRQLAGHKDLIDEQDIEKLPYLRAVVKETLRLFPPGPLTQRETTKKCSINGYEIEAGSMVYINVWAVGRDPAKWENAEEFMPERFLGSEVDVMGQNPEFIPFGMGRRGCPGIVMGMLQVELALANVLYKFEWEVPYGMKEGDIDVGFVSGLAVHKKNALRLLAKVAA